MKRLVIDANSLLPPSGSNALTGIARTVREFIQSLAAADLPFEVVLFGQRLRGPRLADIDQHFTTRQLLLPRWSSIDKLKAWLPIVESICKYDLFHATGNFASISRPERAIVTIHDAMFFAYPESFLGHELEVRRIPRFARSCRAIITCSQSSKNDIVNYMQIEPDKIHVLPWGVRHDLFRPHTDPDQLRAALRRRFGLKRPFFLQVSCDIGRKNSPLVFDAYRAFLQKAPENDLVLVWRNPPREILAIRDREHLEGRVHLVSDVSDEDLRLLYCGATAMLFPSAYEGFGLPVLEAMACGTPVVTTRGGALPEVGGDAAIYIELEDPEAMSRVLEHFATDTYDRSQISRRGIEHASRFTWERYVADIIPIYNRCLECD